MLRKIITAPGSWLHKHPWAIVSFLAGLIAGIGAAKLIAGFPSADAIASILGAGIGSALAVMGAVWASNREERRRRNSLLSSLIVITEPTVDKTEELLAFLAGENRDNELAFFKIKDAIELVSITNATLSDMQPLFLRDIGENMAYQLTTGHCNKILKQLNSLYGELNTAGNRMYPQYWDRTDFSELSKAAKSLRRDTRFIM